MLESLVMASMHPPGTAGSAAGVRLASRLTLIQAFRVVGLLFLIEMFRGNLTAVFAGPTAVGDLLIGITAPVMALALRKGGARTWAIAITWQALGVTDLVYALTLGIISGGATYVLSSYLIVIPTVGVPIAFIVHFVAIRTLMKREVRAVFLARG